MANRQADLLCYGPEERLACLLSQARLQADDEQQCRRLTHGKRFSWETFWHLVNFNCITVLAAQKLKSIDIHIPQKIEQQVEQIRRQSKARRERFLRVLPKLAGHGIEVYLLKGSLLGETVYGDPFYKKMNDIDILVRKEFAPLAVKVFEQSGFQLVRGLFGKKEIDFRLHHSPPLISEDGTAVIGLHWNLTSPFAKRHPRGDLFQSCEKVPMDVCVTNRLSWERNLLHLCIHLPFYKIGLRELADVANLALWDPANFDWDLFFFEARCWRAEDAVYRVFQLSNAVIPWYPEGFERQISVLKSRLGVGRYTSDTEQRIAHRGMLVRSRSVYIGTIEKHFVLFKLADSYREKAFHLAQQWKSFLFCPLLEQERFLGRPLSRTTIKTQLRCCMAIWHALSQDLGSFYLFSITAKNVFSLLKSCVVAPLRKRDAEKQQNLNRAVRLMENIE